MQHRGCRFLTDLEGGGSAPEALVDMLIQAEVLLSFAHHLCLEELCHPRAVQGGHILNEDPQVFPTRLRSDPTHSTDAIHSPLLQRDTSA